jgi:hypothetical protein
MGVSVMSHYSIIASKGGMGLLRSMFPDGEANEMNFVLFSTSGVHGSYTTIEEIETGIQKYGDSPEFDDEWPNDYSGNELTYLIVQPRVVSMTYGNAQVALADVPFLKRLRQTSFAAVLGIGVNEATPPPAGTP